MEILSPGKKIKKIRKELKINQREITGGEITRELISIIENDKSTLTAPVAKIITDNINRICKERKIDFNLKAEYLLEDVQAQVNNIADKYIEFLCKNEENISEDFTKKVEEIEVFFRKYDAPEKKMIIYEKIGDILRGEKEYSKSYIYYIKALENHKGLDRDVRVVSILQKLGGVCINLGNDNESLNFNSLALKYDDIITEELMYNILYNNTLAYMHINNYDKALQEIEHIQNTFKVFNKENIFEINILKANCLRYKKFYNEVLELNVHMLSTLDKNKDIEKLILVTANILDIYTVLKDLKNVRIYIDKLVYLLDSYDEVRESFHCPNAYNQLGISYELIGNIELSIEAYKKSIELSKYQNNKRILIKSLDKLLDVLIKERNLEEINKYKNELIELISQDIIEVDTTPVFKLMNFYNDVDDRESLRGLLKFILEYRKDGQEEK